MADNSEKSIYLRRKMYIVRLNMFVSNDRFQHILNYEICFEFFVLHKLFPTFFCKKNKKYYEKVKIDHSPSNFSPIFHFQTSYKPVKLPLPH